MPLSDAACRSAKGREKLYKMSDSGGLQLWVHPTGSRTWRLAYRHNGQQKNLTLGTYPDLKLAEAREYRDAAKRTLREGVDPAKRTEHEGAPVLFKDVAKDWFDAAKTPWTAAHQLRVWNRVDKDLVAVLGQTDIRDIAPKDVLAALRKVEERGAIDMAKRIRQYAGSVFRYAIANGVRETDPTAHLDGALKAKPRVKHHAFVREKDLPELVGKIDRYDGQIITRLALFFTLQTMVRTNETQFAVWEEFENLQGDNPLWRIPASRMKRDTEHVVPLAKQTVKLIEQIRQHSGGKRFLFPGESKTGAMSNNTMLFALYRLGYHSRATVHGFRRTASTILNESNLFNSDWIELQLAHVEDDKVRKAYNAAEWLSARRKMVQWWNDQLDAALITGKEKAAKGEFEG